MKLLVMVILTVTSLLLSSCSSGPADNEASKVIMGSLGVSNVIVRDKKGCELSANSKAQGVSERWIITFDDVNPSAQPQQQTGVKVTIQKRDGQWEWYNATAYCGK